MKRPKHCQNLAETAQMQYLPCSPSGQKGGRRTASKGSPINRLAAGARLSKMILTDEKIYTVEALHNRQNWHQLLQQKSAVAKP
ncbi:hypothetical protein KIN20_015731 [Parelaphostrongylus tenuis]|uniref:Uncharacterized protein n=1 Tax=Parelaphostrongylus tenuis TaxID=148309 RepID=A0AAD5MK69_PARTN|nr:hypothetical protein KIN20_015731 [Parelaphostrongylus tenuis]